MLLALSVDNTAMAAQTVTVSVSVSGSALAPYLNVNNDSTQVDLTNWNCTPNETRPSGAGPFVFTCTASIPAGTTNTVMVTTGSNLPAGAKGTSVTVQASVTADTPAGTPFPTPASLTQAVA
jgi:hypothetical protein